MSFSAQLDRRDSACSIPWTQSRTCRASKEGKSLRAGYTMSRCAHSARFATRHFGIPSLTIVVTTDLEWALSVKLQIPGRRLASRKRGFCDKNASWVPDHIRGIRLVRKRCVGFASGCTQACATGFCDGPDRPTMIGIHRVSCHSKGFR
jgi:hypothetical protein